MTTSRSRSLRRANLVIAAFACLATRPRSGRILLMKRRSIRNAHDHAILRQEPGHRLAPRLRPGTVQQLVTRPLQLLTRRGDGFHVRHLELDRHLRDRPASGPFGRAKARLGRLRQRPHAEVLNTRDVPARVIAIALTFQWKAESTHI
jgi:hypothetical protein